MSLILVSAVVFYIFIVDTTIGNDSPGLHGMSNEEFGPIQDPSISLSMSILDSRHKSRCAHFNSERKLYTFCFLTLYLAITDNCIFVISTEKIYILVSKTPMDDNGKIQV